MLVHMKKQSSKPEQKNVVISVVALVEVLSYRQVELN